MRDQTYTIRKSCAARQRCTPKRLQFLGPWAATDLDFCNGQFSSFLVRAFKDASTMFQRCFKDVSNMFQRCFKDVSNMFQRCFKDVSNMFQRCFKDVSKMFQRCFKDVSKMFQRCFKDVSKMFQRWYKDGTRLPEVIGTSKSNRSSHFHRRGLACVGATVLGSFVVTGVIFAIGGIWHCIESLKGVEQWAALAELMCVFFPVPIQNTSLLAEHFAKRRSRADVPLRWPRPAVDWPHDPSWSSFWHQIDTNCGIIVVIIDKPNKPPNQSHMFALIPLMSIMSKESIKNPIWDLSAFPPQIFWRVSPNGEKVWSSGVLVVSHKWSRIAADSCESFPIYHDISWCYLLIAPRSHSRSFQWQLFPTVGDSQIGDKAKLLLKENWTHRSWEEIWKEICSGFTSCLYQLPVHWSGLDKPSGNRQCQCFSAENVRMKCPSWSLV